MNQDSISQYLHGACFARLHFRLRLEEALVLPPYGLLRLRREFHRLLKGGMLSAESVRELGPVLRPPLPVDPELRRRVQQPSPGFVLPIEEVAEQSLPVGAVIRLPVCFIEGALPQAAVFCRLVEALGAVGLSARRGRYRLEAIEDGFSPPGAVQTLWQGGEFAFAPRLKDLAHLMEDVSPPAVRFEFLTPARLMKGGRPLFRPGFDDIFPFLLRRVTSMLAAWCALENLVDVTWALEVVRGLEQTRNRLRWHDWRPGEGNESFGGIYGSIDLAGEELREIWYLLRLGELFGVGKGAAFGAGRYRLLSSIPLSPSAL